MTDISIIMPTFNKEKYISKALDSIFAQQTSYNFQVIIPDDHSTDKTLSIIQDYQTKHPDKITLLTSDINQKLYKNVVRAYARTQTPYFCVLDPDDYWTDPLHLQKALDFLSSHPAYTIYCSDILKLYPNGTQTPCQFAAHPTTSTFADFLNDKATLAFTQSSVYRNVIFSQGLPEPMQNLFSQTAEKSFRGDSFRNIIHLHEGKAYYTPEIHSVYRITQDGIWAGSTQLERLLLNASFLKDMWLYFDKKYPELLTLSYKNYLQIQHSCVDLFAHIQKEHTLFSVVQELATLNDIYKQYHTTIKQCFISKQSLKNKIRLKLYQYLEQKLYR